LPAGWGKKSQNLTVILIKSGYRGYKVEKILPIGREKNLNLPVTLLKKVVTEVTVVTKLGE
jgi:hypothetical protein